MNHEKLVAGTESPTRYTKIIRNPGAGTKYNRTYQEADYVSRYTKTVAGGKDYAPPAPPEPEIEELAVAPNGGANLVAENVYEIGEAVTGKTAVFTGGNPETTTYRSRWQTRPTSSDSWVNSNWMNTTNAKNDHIYPILAAGQLRFQSQARDTSDDPVTQVNSFTSVKTITEPLPPTTIGGIALTVDDVLHTYGEPIHVAVHQSLRVVASITGDADASYLWEARGGYPLMISEQAASTILTFPQQDNATCTLTVRDNNASDSPMTYALSVYVASQAEWDALHPESN